jgi:superfamily I DNA and/or RNA helicase
VGDPLQLPPIVSLSFKDLYDKQNQNQKSLYKPLFVRLQIEGLETILLRIQYRCHPSIAELSNVMFYENNLMHGVGSESRERLLSDFEAVNFINAERGKETRSEVSYKNYYEAKFIVALLEYIQTIIENK